MGAQYWTPRSDRNDDFRQKLTRSGLLVPFAENEIAQDPYRGPVKTHLVGADDKGFRAMVEHLLEGVLAAVGWIVQGVLIDCLSVLAGAGRNGDEALDALAELRGAGREAYPGDDRQGRAGDRQRAGAHVPHPECTISAEGFFRAVQRRTDWSNRWCVVDQVLSILKESKTFQVAPEILRSLEGVTYSQRFAAAYVFDEKAAAAVQELGWTAKYVPSDESDIIRFVCWDHLKKQSKDQSHPALIVHTSVAFGSTFMDDTRHNDEILAIITKSLREPVGEPDVPSEAMSAPPNPNVSQQEERRARRTENPFTHQSPAHTSLAGEPLPTARNLQLGSEKLLACIDLWRTQTIDFNPADGDKLEFSIAIGEQSYLLKADSQDDAARWVKGLQARQHRPEGTPSEVFSLRSEHMDAESDASSSEYGGRRPRGASSDSGSRRSSLSYVETQNPVVPNANAIARLSLSHADAPNPVVPNANLIARSSFSHAEAPNPVVPTASTVAAGAKYPMVNTNQQVTRSVVAATAAGKTPDDENPANAQCCAPCLIM
ncbi:unnamed protein product [Phytophthora lilii]|uniref:Unnamed protein product n=1 Tax=Phytophthora lilii TaxID=2077276 RepID=A0A9W6YKE0_9STRA|nr:unnamed protein product [Phytophthora lilii]